MDSVKDREEPHLVALLEALWRRTKHELDKAARELAPDLRPSHVRLISITPADGLRLGDLATKARDDRTIPRRVSRHPQPSRLHRSRP